MSLPSKVKPGDLISSALFNDLVDYLKAQDQRLTQLEASIAVLAILDVLPAGLIRMGTEMRVLGRGFGTAGLNTVLIDTVMVTAFKAGSSDSQLIFDLPTIPNVPPEGRPVSLSVSNARGFASTTVQVGQALPTVPDGSIQATMAQAPTGTITAGGTYDFFYTLKVISNMDETFKLAATLQPTGTTGTWVTQVTDTTTQRTPLPNGELFMARGDAPNGTVKQIVVRATVPAGVTGSAKLRLVMTSKLNVQFTGSSGDFGFTVGSTSQTPTIPLSRTLVSPTGALNTTTDEVQASPGTQVTLRFAADIPVAGTYQVTLSLPADTTNLWGAKLSSASPSTPLVWQFNMSAAGSTNIYVTVQPGATAPASADLSMTVVSTTDSSKFGQVSQKLKRV
ncbi:hypothetical protein DRW03_24385 [Corallococcus sp. H22C18031201]|uniref:hypothetical protein n=1 Tax=Citreicoccus inhibens TaxID=2849499 RepID=UPI000E713B5F|nr:hypothetical protein [Citreicoccus inhibens]MBU8896480.1 hypothetical protein [Citreicoccus inhibens]RJS18801.1 hypothetical protein DRW03_24385 [Corallococcus sp. H22C18031201]